MRWVLPVCVALFSPSLATVSWAQVDANPDTTFTDSTHLQPGSLFFPSIDTLPTAEHKTKSAGKAMLFSALLPGAGQLYNESYWKVPIVVGFGVYFASQWLHNNRLYKDYRDQYAKSLLQNPAGNSRLLQIREFYKDQRDTFTWYMAILYFINVADAYVDASLYDFSVSGDLSIRLMPAPTGMALRVSF